MEELFIILLFIATVVLWVRHLVVSDRVNGLRYRVQKLEKQLQEQTRQDAPAELSPSQTDTPPQETQPAPEPVVSVQESVLFDEEPTPFEPAAPAQPFENEPQPRTEPVLNAETQPAAAAPSVEFSPAKLFSWIGGLMLFLGCVFGIKYAVENNLLSPAARIICSTGLGFALAAAGYFIRREKYRVTAHTLLGSGLAVIYASVYCAHAFYQFIPPAVTFILLALTAFAAFGAAIGKNAKYVGYLGAVIAFLTPLLVHSGSDSWIALFTYILFINAAAALAAAKRGWNGLLICTLAFTWLSQTIWLLTGPEEACKLNAVCTFFSLYALGAARLAHKRLFNETASTALGLFLCGGMTLMFPLAGLLNATAAVSVKILGYTLFVNVLILWQAGRGNLPAPFSLAGKIIAFLTLFIWSNAHFNDISPVLLFGSFIVFAAVNGGAEFIGRKRENAPVRMAGFSAIYPALLMLPLVCALAIKPEIPFSLAIIALGLLFILMSGAVVFAVLAGAVAAAAAGIGLTVLVLLSLTGRMTDWSSLQTLALVWLGFIPAVLGGGLAALVRRWKGNGETLTGESILSALTALSPFVLVLSVILQNPQAKLISPHWLMGAVLAICALNALAARIYKNASFLPAALAGAVAVQAAFPFTRQTVYTLAGWSAGIFALFFAFPFMFKKHFWQSKAAWAAAALSGVTTSAAVYLWLHPFAKEFHWGLLPAAFLLIYLPVVKKLWTERQTDERTVVPLAFAAGAALFFFTAIFPLEMGGKWLTLAWAMEGSALIWLNTRVPYKGLTGTGCGLLAFAFLRLLFPDLTPVPAARIWNWYLGVYGVCAASAILAARWWPEPSNRFCKKSLAAMGGITLFWLLNIEIAHWFADGRLSFVFTGRLAEALAYTLGWALFGGACIGIGLFCSKPAASKAGAGVIILALIKFFLSDIWQLEALYRIIGLFALAIILIAASFYYQRKRKV